MQASRALNASASDDPADVRSIRFELHRSRLLEEFRHPTACVEHASLAPTCRREGCPPVGIMTRKNRTLSPVVQLFIEHLRAVAKSMSAPAEARKG